MVSPPMEKSLIYDIKVSSIGPADVTGSDLIYEPGNLDLAMKLHYLRGIYYFGSPAFEGLTTLVIKEPMFMWLNKYPMTCGRFRRSESGRPFLKCNDCGVRFIEGKCEKTLDEWLEMKDKDVSLEKLLVPNQVIGPELGFSPLVFVQLTRFKCGGTAVGVSWAHVLGDASSVAEYMNSLGRAVGRRELGEPVNLTQTLTRSTPPSDNQPNVGEDPLSIKRVGSVKDNWVHVAKVQMGAFSFNVTPTLLKHLESKLGYRGHQFGPFEVVSSIVWQCIARIRGKEAEPSVVTICKKGRRSEVNGALGNRQVLSVIKTEFGIADANLSKLASTLKNDALEENEKIDEVMEREQGLADFIVYGANLTFVNLEGAPLYEFDYRGQKPVNVSYRIDGVGDQGAVLVIPGPKDGGRGVMAIFHENEIVELKSELEREGLIA